MWNIVGVKDIDLIIISYLSNSYRNIILGQDFPIDLHEILKLSPQIIPEAVRLYPLFMADIQTIVFCIKMKFYKELTMLHEMVYTIKHTIGNRSTYIYVALETRDLAMLNCISKLQHYPGPHEVQNSMFQALDYLISRKRIKTLGWILDNQLAIVDIFKFQGNQRNIANCILRKEHGLRSSDRLDINPKYFGMLLKRNIQIYIPYSWHEYLQYHREDAKILTDSVAKHIQQDMFKTRPSSVQSIVPKVKSNHYTHTPCDHARHGEYWDTQCRVNGSVICPYRYVKYTLIEETRHDKTCCTIS